MSCYNPIPAVDLGYKVNKLGQKVRDIKMIDIKHRFFAYGLDDLKAHFGDSLLLLPCGHCYGCAIDYSRMWASRIILESQYHQENCFITLTYADCFVPDNPSKRHFQLFMKRLRKELSLDKKTVRFFACGEIGEHKGERKVNPHYHAIIFGFDFPDKVFLKRSSSGLIIYRSPTLERLWPYGLSSIGSVTSESAQYVAKYSMKRKLTGEDNGEFVLMSRRPGIGIQGYSDELYITDKLYLNGKTWKVPRYFDKIASSDIKNFDYFIAKDKRKERMKNTPSSKFGLNLEREEFALDYNKESQIRKDVLKVRNL